jgi:hypothetical protein
MFRLTIAFLFVYNLGASFTAATLGSAQAFYTYIEASHAPMAASWHGQACFIARNMTWTGTEGSSQCLFPFPWLALKPTITGVLWAMLAASTSLHSIKDTWNASLSIMEHFMERQYWFANELRNFDPSTSLRAKRWTTPHWKRSL